MTRYALLALALLFSAAAHATNTPPADTLPIEKKQLSKDFKQEKRALTRVEAQSVARLLTISTRIVQRYVPKVAENRITARTLDRAYDAWLKDKRTDKPLPKRVIPAFGVRLGMLTLKSCKGDWLHVKDNYGEAIAIEFRKSGQQIYPIDSVNKRYSRGERDFFNNLYRMYLLACHGKLK